MSENCFVTGFMYGATTADGERVYFSHKENRDRHVAEYGGDSWKMSWEKAALRDDFVPGNFAFRKV